MAAEQPASELALSVEIVSAYVAKNQVQANELPELIQAVYLSLVKTGQPEAPIEPPAAKLTAAQIKKSITPDALISFIDGRPYKTLKRHLTTNGMTVEAYKSKYGLPLDYPITAPTYSAHRAAMARSIGLGIKGRKADQSVETTAAPASRGMKRSKDVVPES